MGSKSIVLRTLVAASSAKKGGFWRSQFCTEVARPTRFERVTSTFGGWRSIQLSYGRFASLPSLTASRWSTKFGPASNLVA